MKKLFYLFTFAIMIIIGMSGCNKQGYKVEYYDKNGNVIKTKELKDYNDTSAYITAYQKFRADLKIENEMQNEYGEEKRTVSFKIFKEDGTDITNVEFSTKEKQEKEINEMFNIRENIVQNEGTKIDSTKIKNLEPYFNIEKDEYDIKGTQWVKPKSAPKYVNRNSIYFYFAEANGKIGKLRLRIQYYANKWLFIKKCIFNIDGFPIEYMPNNVKRDNDSMIWEWSDEEMTPFEASLIDALEYCKSVKVKFVGIDYSDERTLSSKEVTDIKRAIELYKAKGGSI